MAPEPGGEAAIGIQSDALWREELQRLAHAGDDSFRAVDMPWRDIHAIEADVQVLAQLAEDGHVPCLRGGELHGEMVRLEFVQVADDGAVAAAVADLASCTFTRTAKPCARFLVEAGAMCMWRAVVRGRLARGCRSCLRRWTKGFARGRRDEMQ